MFDIIFSRWINETELKSLTSITASSACISLIFGIDSIVNKYNDYDLWIALVCFIIILITIPSVNNAVIRSSLKRLSDPDFVRNVSVEFAIKDISIGFRYGHPKVVDCTHIKHLLRIFPDNFKLQIMCSRMAVILSRVPLSLNETAEYFSDRTGFWPFQTQAYSSINRIIAPSLDIEIERYNRDKQLLLKLFPRLFDGARSIFDVIEDEVVDDSLS